MLINTGLENNEEIDKNNDGTQGHFKRSDARKYIKQNTVKPQYRLALI